MQNRSTYLPAGAGRAYWGAGDTYTFLVTGTETGGSYFTMHALVPPSGGPPAHIHHREEEQFYVLEGNLTFRVGLQTIYAGVGDFIHIPRNTIHYFKNEEKLPARMLVSYSPAGIEKLFETVFTPVTDPLLLPPPWTDKDTARFVALEAFYGMESLLPDDPRLVAIAGVNYGG
jgi:quercetin dioxygenase-like cupin family protein